MSASRHSDLWRRQSMMTNTRQQNAILIGHSPNQFKVSVTVQIATGACKRMLRLFCVRYQASRSFTTTFSAVACLADCCRILFCSYQVRNSPIQKATPKPMNTTGLGNCIVFSCLRRLTPLRCEIKEAVQVVTGNSLRAV
jgi:hypothetical protein